MSNTISADIGSEDTHNRFSLPEIPGYESLVPSSRVDHMLTILILIKFGTVYPIGMTIMRRIGFLQLDDLLPLNLIIDTDNRLTASRHQLRSIVVVVQTVELFIDGA